MPGTVLITGANGSLALGFAESFLELYPEYTLVATVRNPSPDKDPNTAKLARLVSRYPLAKVHIEALDLGNLAGVHSFADNLSERISSGMLPPISAIVCNAMTWSLESGQKFTSDGYEATFQVAHLAHYLLVLKLLANMDKEAGRIVMLGSATHYPEKKNPLSSLRPGIPDAKNIEELVHPTPDPEGLAHDRGFQRYGTSKLANVIFAEDLNGRLKQHPDLCNITATAMDPGGLLESRGQTGQKASVQRMFAVLRFYSGRDLVALSLDPAFHGERGYFVGQKRDAPAAIVSDVEVQKRLWEACWTWAGLKPEETVFSK